MPTPIKRALQNVIQRDKKSNTAQREPDKSSKNGKRDGTTVGVANTTVILDSDDERQAHTPTKSKSHERLTPYQAQRKRQLEIEKGDEEDDESVSFSSLKQRKLDTPLPEQHIRDENLISTGVLGK